jgi:hypothetical protein
MPKRRKKGLYLLMYAIQVCRLKYEKYGKKNQQKETIQGCRGFESLLFYKKQKKHKTKNKKHKNL